MLATITVTPVDIVNYEEMKVINNDMIFKVYFDWEDKAEMFDTMENKMVEKRIVQMSVYDDRFLLNGLQHHCLHMFSK
ncbi:hypothetical protein [Paenibacillus sp. FSL H7-0331]|uniref:hypothetical protein n=1 Tax=Paenibacillus sp. FSL H7-0331 TaxID=1920421 RepID=UPI00096E31F3|nr:hypothetical protein [Paenibacillus sp. FSL H7-0331]OME97321.1 hypothetical protein BK127_40895 [Paenibacillus sp. FSL H7-0331]